MIPYAFRRTVPVFLSVVLAFAAGCAGTAPSKFYTLTPMKGPDPPGKGVAAEEGCFIAVGPVILPDYLDRPQILTRSEGNEVRLHETERWAGSLEGDVSRVLLENLSELLAGNRITVVRWSPATQPQVAFRNRVGVEILRFEGPLGGTVELKARYTLYGADGRKVLAVGESTVREPAGGPGYEALVAAMSKALATLSRDIAAALLAR
ncbi:MAG: hypothetical protein C3F14_09930 [Deltaproteobacteria bacterium]|nr:MAG: hypothetical protein C3F14_09930 [Deltaproteobacteria bacterium]